MLANQGQVLTDDQCMMVAKRLFRAIDQEERRTLNKEQAVEFVAFMREHLFHGVYKEERDRAPIEAMFDQLEGENYDVEYPNPRDPVNPIKRTERRIKFKPLYLNFYDQAKSDGCLWVPFEETTNKVKKPMDYAEAMEADSPTVVDRQAARSRILAKASESAAALVSEQNKQRALLQSVINVSPSPSNVVLEENKRE